MRLYPIKKIEEENVIKRLVEKKFLKAYVFRSEFFVLVDRRLKNVFNFLDKPLRGYRVIAKATPIKNIPYGKKKNHNRKSQNKGNE